MRKMCKEIHCGAMVGGGGVGGNAQCRSGSGGANTIQSGGANTIQNEGANMEFCFSASFPPD